MSYRKMIKNLRTLAHDLIKTAVINQNGCIGTMYDHQGIRHKACSADRRYYFTPSVAVMPDKKEKQDSIGIFKIVEIFVDTQKQLYCSIQLKNGEIVEVPFDRILIDYLNIILYWLTFNGFMPHSPTEGEKIKICKYCHGMYGDLNEGVCANCEGNHPYAEVPIDELPEKFFNNWYDSLGLMELVSINKYKLEIFDSFNDFISVKATAMIEWEEYSYEQKKAIWLKHYNNSVR